jgi:hypothetical protein
MDIKSLESELMKLSPSEKAQITAKLLASLEAEGDEDLDVIWLNEALTRYDQLIKDNTLLIDSELVIKEAKSKYH